MRTIKFRGKSRGGDWIYSDCIINGGNEFIRLFKPKNGWITVISATVGQYVGYRDCHGKEIYEGDIISFDDGYETESGYCEQRGCIGKVFWDEETVAFYVTDRLSCESYEALADCEVIGNIYDNKNLIFGDGNNG